jgi:hypothetical protein
VKRYEMDVKYHGILLGKKGVTVKALEKASGATIRFETTPKGALVIMGTEKQRDVAWKLITSVQSTLPKILSQIRGKEIRSLWPLPSPLPCPPSVYPFFPVLIRGQTPDSRPASSAEPWATAAQGQPHAGTVCDGWRRVLAGPASSRRYPPSRGGSPTRTRSGQWL